MSISTFFSAKNNQNDPASAVKYSSSLKRGCAAIIDMGIVLLLRIIFMTVIGSLWLTKEMVEFRQEFEEKFGTQTINQVHIDFIIQHPIFLHYILTLFGLVLIGVFYHSYFNSSTWSATLGKRIMGIMILKKGNSEEFSRISLSLGVIHYALSMLPLIFLMYLAGYIARYNVDMVEAITHSSITVFFAVIFFLWIQVQAFNRQKITMYDWICGTVFINGKNPSKLPRYKIKD